MIMHFFISQTSIHNLVDVFSYQRNLNLKLEPDEYFVIE